MNNLKVNECLLVSVDFTKGEDTGVLIVGRQEKEGKVNIVNAFQGQEAVDIYKKLITVKNKANRFGIDRNYYDESGRQSKQISNNNHGHPKAHKYGKKGEHAHDYIYDNTGKLIGRPIRELNDKERKENGDIL